MYPIWFVPTSISPHLQQWKKPGRADVSSDTRFVLAKGAGPGIYNQWNTNSNGVRVFFARVHPDYLL